MATTPYGAQRYRADQPFFVRFSLVISLLIIVSFAQFAARGMVDYAQVPIWIHVHGVVMVTWLGLFVIQNRLAETGEIDLHRKLGRLAVMLVAAIVGLGCFAGIMALKRATYPPFFTAPYFLALTQIEAVVFGGLVVAAVVRRKDTETHRRLMSGALVMITEPAFGRLLPMPLLGNLAEWSVLLLQIVMLAVLASHDRRVMGRVHPATMTCLAVVALSHVLVDLSATSPMVQQLAARLAG